MSKSEMKRKNVVAGRPLMHGVDEIFDLRNLGTDVPNLGTDVPNLGKSGYQCICGRVFPNHYERTMHAAACSDVISYKRSMTPDVAEVAK